MSSHDATHYHGIPRSNEYAMIAYQIAERYGKQYGYDSAYHPMPCPPCSSDLKVGTLHTLTTDQILRMAELPENLFTDQCLVLSLRTLGVIV